MARETVLRYTGASTCIVITVVTWVAMGEGLQDILKIYPQPCFIVYWIHSWYSVSHAVVKVLRCFPCTCSITTGDSVNVLSWKRALWSSGVLAVLYFMASYFWYLSLHRTSVPANTAILQSLIGIVFLLSIFILKETITLLKIVAIVICIGGAVIVAIYSETDKSSPVPQSAMGYIYLAISIILNSLGEILFKKCCTSTVNNDPAAAVMNSMWIFGLLGIHTLLWMWPPIIVLHYSGLETFNWPLPDVAKEVLKLMFFSAVIDSILNASLFTGIALSSPLFISVGQVTAVPVSIITDYIIYHKTATYIVYIGMISIIVGFLGFCVSEFMHLRRNKGREKEASAVVLPNDSSNVINNDKETQHNERSSLLISKATAWHNKYLKYIV